MATETTEAPFAIRSLVGDAGTGSNGEKLVNALSYMYPQGLKEAQLRRPNPDLTDDLDLDEVKKIVGDGVDIRDVQVRGGEQRSEDAWVSYAGYDAEGDTVKGAFPFPDLGKSSSDDHISQRDGLQESEAARDHAFAQAKADAAAPAPASSGDPIADYEEMRAGDVVAYVKEHPERADVIAALEGATRPGDERKTVLEAIAEAKAAGDDSGSEGGSRDGKSDDGSGT